MNICTAWIGKRIGALAIAGSVGLFIPSAKSSELPTRTLVSSDAAPIAGLIVTYKPTLGMNAKSADRDAFLTQLNREHRNAFDSIRPMALGRHVATFKQAAGIEAATALADRLRADPRVEHVELDAILTAHVTPTDSAYARQWHLHDAFGGINAPVAWDLTSGVATTVVAVLDTGATTHPELAGRLLPGYDFISDVARGNDGDGRDADASDPGDWVNAADVAGGAFPATCRLRNSSWHGTMVAGAIAAARDGRDVVGLDAAARILPVRVLGKCGGTISDITDAMLWAAGFSVPGVPDNANPAHILNLSLGGLSTCSAATQAAVDRITAAGKVIVVSAGNDSVDVARASPANCRGVIAVAASNRFGARAGYSNVGVNVVITAPGGEAGDFITTGNLGATTPGAAGVVGTSGTSFSAPVVSGILALARAVRPDMNTDLARQWLQRSARAFPDGSCGITSCGAGIVDAVGVVRLARDRGIGLAHSVAFGEADGGSRFLQMRVTGIAQAPQVRMSGPQATEFVLGDARCATDANGPTCELQFTFNPLASGLRNATMTLVAGGQEYVLPVVGFSTAAASATDWSIATPGAYPTYLTRGPDGAVWYTLYFADRIGRIDATGRTTEFPVTPFSGPFDIATGRDGNVWFTLQDAGKIGRMTPQGVLTEFDLPNPDAVPRSLVAAPDGFIYFTLVASGKVGRIDMNGRITEYSIPWGGANPRGIDVDASGNLWFADSANSLIGRMSADGRFTAFPTPWANGVMRNVRVARDGSVWFTEVASDRIGQLTPATGVMRSFILNRSGGQPLGLTEAADGAIWFTTSAANRVGRITAGTLTEMRLPATSGAPFGLITMPDGKLWYTAASANRVGRIDPAASLAQRVVQDLWWSAGEGGHGVSIQQKSGKLFVTWYLYDATGKPIWLVIPSGTWNTDQSVWTGLAYAPKGSWYARFDARQVQVGAPMGELRLRFTGDDQLTIEYSLGTLSGTKAMQRFPFATAGQSAPGSFGDIWYGGANNGGWGLAINQQQGSLFMAWYTYDRDGSQAWFVVPGGTWSGRTFAGKVFKTAGAQVLGAPFDPARVRASEVGTMEVIFTPDGRNATMLYTVEGNSGFESIGRLPL
jgi:serine protease